MAQVLDSGRDICGDRRLSEEREWLVTNGLGGYASGTLAGTRTRRYHGLLIAALEPPVGRTLLIAKLDETVAYGGQSYPLFSNRWENGALEPQGYRHLERFHLEGTTPVWTFALADALLEKRVWMQPGADTTYIHYKLIRASGSVALAAQALAAYRDHHGTTRASAWQVAGGRMSVEVQPLAQGLRVIAFEGAAPIYVLSDRAEAAPAHEWFEGLFLSVEAYRGQEPVEDLLHVADLRAVLGPGESLTLVVGTTAGPNLDGATAYAQRRAHERQLLDSARPYLSPMSPAVEQLVLAADQFVVHRALPDGPGRSIIAGYPWFSDWGRDTMISLPGLTLVTGRHDVAAQILLTFAEYVSMGMLPNRFPDEGQAPEYNTVDATLWYFEAVRAYYNATGDGTLLRDLFPVLRDIVDWHVRGTRYQIHVDPSDGLLYAGESGVQLTWMDAKVDDWVVTPRIGKPVEVNALWYNALCIMADFARLLGKSPDRYQALAERARAGFARFWNRPLGYCYDVVDGPQGDDPALRPNQLLAVSLPHSPLSSSKQRAVVDVCARHLLTSYGLRSLAPDDPAYVGHYGGNRRLRDAAYHQGTVWGWLIGPFVSAHLRAYGDRELARSFLRPLLKQLENHAVGSLSEIFDGDPPFPPRGCIAQAWSVAEVLRAWQATTPAASDVRET